MFFSHGPVSSTNKMVLRERGRTNMSGRCAVVTRSVGKTNPPKSDCTTQSVLGASPLLATIFHLGYTFVPALTNSIVQFGTPNCTIES